MQLRHLMSPWKFPFRAPCGSSSCATTNMTKRCGVEHGIYLSACSANTEFPPVCCCANHRYSYACCGAFGPIYQHAVGFVENLNLHRIFVSSSRYRHHFVHFLWVFCSGLMSSESRGRLAGNNHLLADNGLRVHVSSTHSRPTNRILMFVFSAPGCSRAHSDRPCHTNDFTPAYTPFNLSPNIQRTKRIHCVAPTSDGSVSPASPRARTSLSR